MVKQQPDIQYRTL